jgi:uncharacterized protein
MEAIIGRKEEQKTLQKIYASSRAEFLALYGRRRVGKTYLIKQFFSDKACYYFQITGMKDGSLKEQLYEFTRAVEKTFYTGTTLKESNSWMQALEMLTNAIEQYSGKQKVVLFFDELPWLATKRSRILQALDYYWNTKWVDNPKVRLIVCGSAASWITENIINNKGGLHNRITYQIRLEPFSLTETSSFLKYRGIHLNDKQVLFLYMVVGGIPHYLNQVQKGLSVSQNVDKLCFTKNGILFKEFNNLIPALFDEAEIYKKVIHIIAKYRYGIGRNELLKQLKLPSGGSFNHRLIELEEAGFILSFKPYGHAKRGQYYRVIDEYTLFYLNWIAPVATSVRHQDKPRGYWEGHSKLAKWKSWSGYAFEAFCYKHIVSIREALNIPVTAEVGSWRYSPLIKSDDNGAQIDLLFDRDDGVVTICEIKYTQEPFNIDKSYANNLLNKVEVYKKQTRTTKQIFIAMVTSSGLKPTIYSEELISNQVGLSDFLKES